MWTTISTSTFCATEDRTRDGKGIPLRVSHQHPLPAVRRDRGGVGEEDILLVVVRFIEVVRVNKMVKVSGRMTVCTNTETFTSHGWFCL